MVVVLSKSGRDGLTEAAALRERFILGTNVSKRVVVAAASAVITFQVPHGASSYFCLCSCRLSLLLLLSTVAVWCWGHFLQAEYPLPIILSLELVLNLCLFLMVHFYISRVSPSKTPIRPRAPRMPLQ